MATSSTTTTASTGNTHGMTLLPADFLPFSSSVIIGRGRSVDEHNQSNVVLQDLLHSLAGLYLKGTKDEKSELLTTFVDKLKMSENEADDVGFVKQCNKTKQWYTVGAKQKRDTAAQFLRNALSDSYKSSKQFKRHLRQEKRTQKAGPSSKPAKKSLQTQQSKDTACTGRANSFLSKQTMPDKEESKLQLQDPFLYSASSQGGSVDLHRAMPTLPPLQLDSPLPQRTNLNTVGPIAEASLQGITGILSHGMAAYQEERPFGSSNMTRVTASASESSGTSGSTESSNRPSNARDLELSGFEPLRQQQQRHHNRHDSLLSMGDDGDLFALDQMLLRQHQQHQASAGGIKQASNKYDEGPSSAWLGLAFSAFDDSHTNLFSQGNAANSNPFEPRPIAPGAATASSSSAFTYNTTNTNASHALMEQQWQQQRSQGQMYPFQSQSLPGSKNHHHHDAFFSMAL